MKTAYAALVVLTLIVGTRFAREFTSAVHNSRNTALQAAPSVATRTATAGRLPQPHEATLTEFQPHPAVVDHTQPQPVPEPVADQLLSTLPVQESVADVVDTASVRHPGPQHDKMILPGDFEYLGAFRPPHIEGQATSFSYGGATVAFHAAGDPTADADGFPGSLYMVGHIYDQQVAEISIPKPVISHRHSLDDLEVSELLQPFGDISGGIQAAMTTDDSQPFRLGGLQVTDTGLHWTQFRYYNVEGYDFLSHGLSSLDTQRPLPGGPWHLGPYNSGAAEWHAYKHAGYICDIPEFMTAQLGGCTMLSGLQISTGLQTSSQGPALFAYRLPEELPAPGTSLTAVPLLWYSMDHPLAGHHPADSRTGAAWLTIGNKQSVVAIGRKATGPVYYGVGRPQDCSDSKGYHGPPYETQAVFYSTDELIQAAHGQRPASNIQPAYRWSNQSAGGGLSQYLFPTCDQSLGGLAYDRNHNLLYLVQLEAGTTDDNPYEPLPIVHVFRITAEPGGS